MTHQPLRDFVIPAICLGLLAGSLIFTSTPSAPQRPKGPGAPPDPTHPPNPGAEPPP